MNHPYTPRTSDALAQAIAAAQDAVENAYTVIAHAFHDDMEVCSDLAERQQAATWTVQRLAAIGYTMQMAQTIAAEWLRIECAKQAEAARL